MAYGLQIVNDSNELVVDSDAVGLHYVGKATYTGLVEGYIGTSSSQRYRGRYSITLASSAMQPIAGIKLSSNRLVTIDRLFRASAGSATWYFDCYSIDATTPAPITAVQTTTGFDVHQAAEVYVFTQAGASGDAYGLRLYNTSNQITWDFSYRPFLLKEVLTIPARTDKATYLAGDTTSFASGVTNPIIIGFAHGDHQPSRAAGGALNQRTYLYGLESGQISRRRATYYLERDPDGPSRPEIWSLPAATVYVLDANNYD